MSQGWLVVTAWMWLAQVSFLEACFTSKELRRPLKASHDCGTFFEASSRNSVIVSTRPTRTPRFSTPLNET